MNFYIAIFNEDTYDHDPYKDEVDVKKLNDCETLLDAVGRYVIAITDNSPKGAPLFSHGDYYKNAARHFANKMCFHPDIGQVQWKSKVLECETNVQLIAAESMADAKLCAKKRSLQEVSENYFNQPCTGSTYFKNMGGYHVTACADHSGDLRRLCEDFAKFIGGILCVVHSEGVRVSERFLDLPKGVPVEDSLIIDDELNLVIRKVCGEWRTTAIPWETKDSDKWDAARLLKKYHPDVKHFWFNGEKYSIDGDDLENQ